MDTLDTAVIYAIAGGLAMGGVNWLLKDLPPLDSKGFLNYFALFAAMGCLGGSFTYALTINSNINSKTAGLLGGFLGSYFLLGIGNYF